MKNIEWGKVHWVLICLSYDQWRFPCGNCNVLTFPKTVNTTLRMSIICQTKKNSLTKRLHNTRVDPGLFSGGDAPFSGGALLNIKYQLLQISSKCGTLKNVCLQICISDS